MLLVWKIEKRTRRMWEWVIDRWGAVVFLPDWVIDSGRRSPWLWLAWGKWFLLKSIGVSLQKDKSDVSSPLNYNHFPPSVSLLLSLPMWTPANTHTTQFTAENMMQHLQLRVLHWQKCCFSFSCPLLHVLPQRVKLHERFSECFTPDAAPNATWGLNSQDYRTFGTDHRVTAALHINSKNMTAKYKYSTTCSL